MEKVEITWNNIDKFSSVPIEYRFVDKAIVFPGKEAIGMKSVSSLDWYFRYHFPGNPIMPGVLVMEVMQQTGLLIITTMPGVQERVMLFQGCKNMRMYKSVRPGDVLEAKVLLNDFRRGIANFHGEVRIERNDVKEKKLACSMDFMMLLESQMITLPSD